MELIIAGLSLGLLISIFRKQSRRLAAKRSIKWENDKSADKQPADSSKKNPQPLDYQEINRTYRIADMHFARGDFAEAEKWFIKVLSLNEFHPEALNRLGVIYIQQGNPRRAELLYTKLLSTTNTEASYFCNYGRCLYNLDRAAEAIEHYEKAIALDASKPGRFVSIGQIYYEQKEFTKALSYFVRALNLEPNNMDYLAMTAELAQLAGDLDRYRTSIKKMLDLDPYNEELKTKLRTC